jgi:hypothetical protein
MSRCTVWAGDLSVDIPGLHAVSGEDKEREIPVFSLSRKNCQKGHEG